MQLSTLQPWLYLASTIMFILGIKQLSRVKTARRGNTISAIGMGLAVLGTLVTLDGIDWRWIAGGVAVGAVIGVVLATRVAMTSMPELVAALNGVGGMSSALVAASFAWRNVVQAEGAAAPAQTIGGVAAGTTALSILIGMLTLTGSVIAYLKLQGKLKKGAPIILPGRHVINAALLLALIAGSVWWSALAVGPEHTQLGLIGLMALASLLGILVVIPIGGADMPVVVSLLNAYSGLAAAAAGFVLGNALLLIAGAMVGASGLILTQIMCVAMNRSLLNVILGGFGQGDSDGGNEDARDYERIMSSGAAEVAMMLDAASSVVVVPGYGLAVAQAQHAVRDLAKQLEARGITVRYAIHPVAGRMPGHMNVLLAEADVPYDRLVEMEAINGEFKQTDVSLVIGANDVVNPAAIEDKASPLWGMPILNVHESRSVFVIKRSLSPGYAGVKNVLFERENAMMVFGDAKDMLQQIASELEEL